MEAVGFIRKASSAGRRRSAWCWARAWANSPTASTEQTVIAFADIPHFKKVSVAGHAGRLVLGKVGARARRRPAGALSIITRGTTSATWSSRCGSWPSWASRSLLLTNAAGGIGRDLRPGDLMIIRDHINLMGLNPLRGDERRAPGAALSRHERRLRPGVPGDHRRRPEGDRAHGASAGVYLALSGPSYETPAEIRMLAALGADAVGMSTVPEAICARHMGVRVAGISCVTNLAAGISAQPLSHAEVTETAERVKNDFIRLLETGHPKLGRKVQGNRDGIRGERQMRRQSGKEF